MTGANGGADPGARPGWRWDVALSFAGAQRDYVEQVAEALKARGVRCFYDADEQIELWGKYLAEELPAIYGEQAAAVVVFVSAEYAARDWTRLERRAALNRAVRERREYVLPARFDDTPLPGLLSDMVAVDLRGRTPQQFAAMIAAKLADLGHPSCRYRRPMPNHQLLPSPRPPHLWRSRRTRSLSVFEVAIGPGGAPGSVPGGGRGVPGGGGVGDGRAGCRFAAGAARAAAAGGAGLGGAHPPGAAGDRAAGARDRPGAVRRAAGSRRGGRAVPGQPRRWPPSAGRGCGWCCGSIPRRWRGCRGRRCTTRPPGRTCAGRTSWSATSRSPRCLRRCGFGRRCGSWAWSPPPAACPPWTWRRNRTSWPARWPGPPARAWPRCTGRRARPGPTCRTCCWTGSGTCCTSSGTATSTPARTRECWP